MYGKGFFCLEPVYVKTEISPKVHKQLYFPCGHCVFCRLKKALENSLRLQMESTFYNPDEIAFVTLTYDDSFVPKRFIDTSFFEKERFNKFKPVDFDSSKNFQRVLTLDRKDLQKFIKRLRKHLPYPIKYFACGEYGTQGTQRPHFHIIIFGLKPEDYKFIEKSWKFGFSYTKPVDDHSYLYVSGYVNKKLGKDIDRNPFRAFEFLNCSQKLGLRWVQAHYKDFDDEHLTINWKGKYYPLPRYFIRYLQNIGQIHKMSLFELYEIQRLDMDSYFQMLEDKHIDAYTQWYNRVKLANQISHKVNHFRDSNKEL